MFMINSFKNKVTTAILLPDTPDTDGDVVTKEQVQRLSDIFMSTYQSNIDFEHTLNNVDVKVVENYILEEPKEVVMKGVVKTLPTGTWISTFLVKDKQIIEDIRTEKLNGVSVFAVARSKYLEYSNKNTEIPASEKRRITFKDLGEDFIVTHISFVSDPAVQDAKFFAFKSKAQLEGDENMTDEKIMELIDQKLAASKSATEATFIQKIEVIEQANEIALKSAKTESDAAIKAAEDKVVEAETKVTALETENASLKAKVEELENSSEKLKDEGGAAQKSTRKKIDLYDMINPDGTNKL